jgi:hypothetical protein
MDIARFAEQVIATWKRVIGYKPPLGRRSGVASSHWHALYGFKNGDILKKQMNTTTVNRTGKSRVAGPLNAKNEKDEWLISEADNKIDSKHLQLDYSDSSCVLPDFPTIRARVIIALQRASSRMTVNRKKKLGSEGPPSMLFDDCLYWATPDGQRRQMEMLESSRAFYSLSDETANSKVSAADKTSEPQPKIKSRTPTKPSSERGGSSRSRTALNKKRKQRGDQGLSSQNGTRCKKKTGEIEGAEAEFGNESEKPQDAPGNEADEGEESNQGQEETGNVSDPGSETPNEPLGGDDNDTNSHLDQEEDVSCSTQTAAGSCPVSTGGNGAGQPCPKAGSTIFLNEASNDMLTEAEIEAIMPSVHEAFVSHMGSSYIDVLANVTSDEEAGAFNAGIHGIEFYKVPVGDDKFVWYWTFENAISPYMKRRLFQSGNDNLYMSSNEVNPGANKSDRLLRIADERGQLQIFHAKSNKDYPLLASDKASSAEIDLMCCIRYLMGVMDQAIETAAKGKKFCGFRVRQLQILLGTLKGGAYSEHDDSSVTLNHNDNRHVSDKANVEESGYSDSDADSDSKEIEMACSYYETNGSSHRTGIRATRPNQEDGSEEELRADMPSRWEMRVPTVTIANVGPGITVAQLEIFDKSEKKLASIPCGGCTIHLQGFGAQLYTKHRVKVEKGLPSFRQSCIIRMVLSARDPIGTQHNCFDHVLRKKNNLRVAYEKVCKDNGRLYRHYNVATALAGKKQPDKTDGRRLAEGFAFAGVEDEPTNEYDFQDIKLLQSDNIPTFKPPEDMPVHERERFHIPTPSGYVERPESIDYLLLNSRFQKKLRERKVEVVVMPPTSGQHQSNGFRHGRVPCAEVIHAVGAKDEETRSGQLTPGDIVLSAHILKYYNVEKNDRRSRHIWQCGHHAMVSYLLLRHNYKSDFVALDEVQDLLAAKKVVPTDKLLWTAGVGGSAQINGANGAETKHLSEGTTNIPSGTLPHSQDPNNPWNQVLVELQRRGGVVSLFAPARKEDMPWKYPEGADGLGAAEPLHDPEYLQYLGEFEADRLTYHPGEETVGDASIAGRVRSKDSKKLIIDSDLLYLTFRTERHFRLYLKRFDYDNPDKASGGARDAWETITLKLTTPGKGMRKKSSSKYVVDTQARLGYMLNDKGEGGGELKTTEALTPGPHFQGSEQLVNAFFMDGAIDDFIDNGGLGRGPSLSIAPKKSRGNISIEDVVTLAVHIQVAVAARGLRMNLHANGSSTKNKRQLSASILYQDDFVDTLGAVVRASPSPAASRQADVTTAYWLLMCQNSLIPGGEIPDGWECLDANGFAERRVNSMVLTDTLLRMTGRPEAWESFFESEMPGTKPRLLETLEDVDRLAEHFCSISGGNWDGKMVDIVSDQMAGSIPSGANRSPRAFQAFARGAYKDIMDGDFYGLNKPSKTSTSGTDDHEEEDTEDTRWNAQGRLSHIIDSAGDSCSQQDIDKGRTKFLAGIVLADLEEVLKDPFGPVRRVTMGSGGENGYRAVGGDDDEVSSSQCKQQAVLDAMVNHVQTLLGDDELCALGMVRRGDGVAVWKLNQRPFNAVDAEHWLCKCYVLGQYARGTRSYNAHRTARHHCHPFHRPGGLHPSALDRIFRSSHSKFLEMRKKGTFPEIPYKFSLFHERFGEGSVYSLEASERRKLVVDLLQKVSPAITMRATSSLPDARACTRLQPLFGNRLVLCNTGSQSVTSLLRNEFGGCVFDTSRNPESCWDERSTAAICETLGVIQGGEIKDGEDDEGQYQKESADQGIPRQLKEIPGRPLCHVSEIDSSYLASGCGGNETLSELVASVAESANNLWSRKQQEGENPLSIEDVVASGDEESDERPSLSSQVRAKVSGWYVRPSPLRAAAAAGGQHGLSHGTDEQFEPQWAHQKMPRAKMEEFSTSEGSKPLLCYVPLTRAGLIVHVWVPTIPEEDNSAPVGGESYALYIPFGVGVLLPGDSYHGMGGMFGASANISSSTSDFMCLIVTPKGRSRPRRVHGAAVDFPGVAYPMFDRSIHFDECLLRRLKFLLLDGNLPTDHERLHQLQVFDSSVFAGGEQSMNTNKRKRGNVDYLDQDDSEGSTALERVKLVSV